jgi:nitroreductase
MTLTKRPEVLDFLTTRRSRPAKTLTSPAPDREALTPILEAAARAPDHGMLEPWRFLVLEGAALQRLAKATDARAAALGEPDDKREKAVKQFADAPLIIAVIASPTPSPKVPEMEQLLSAGAVCLSLLNAALASGWGANWLTGITAYDRPFLENELGLAENEFVAGYIVIGTETVAPADRPRPDLTAKTSWISE